MYRTIAALLLLSNLIVAQAVTDAELARLLSSPQTLQSAIDIIAASRDKHVPLLLRWAKDESAKMQQYSSLSFGIMKAFGTLPVKGSNSVFE